VKQPFGLLMMMAGFLVLVPDSFVCPPCRAGLQGGCAKVNITPPLGIPLIGSKGKPGDAILDELYARAMVLDDGRTKIAIVSADLLYTPLEEITGPVRKIIWEKTGIPEQNVLVCATHTHSGPEVFTLSKFRPEERIDPAKLDQPYLQTLNRKIADAVFLAQQKMKKVKIGIGGGSAPELLYNRRTKKPDGTVTMTFSVTPEIAATRKIQTGPDGTTSVSFTMSAPSPDLKFGPVDPTVQVLRVEDANDSVVGSMLNFACHPVCIYPSMPTTISADYPGDAMDLVEQTEGGVCLFTLGTAGDMVPYQRGLDAHRQIGKALGAEAVRRLQFVPTSDDVTMDAIRKDLRFPAKTPSSTEGGNKPDEGTDFIQTEIQIIRIGDIYLLGLPGEVLAEVGLEIRRQANVEKLFLISLGNDAIGYVCHKQAYDEGGYEPDSATHLAKGAGETMINEAMGLLYRIKQRK
jgi:neutral ceramidase